MDVLGVRMVIAYNSKVCINRVSKVANLARGQLNRVKEHNSLSPFAPENLASRDGFGFGRLFPRQPARLYIQQTGSRCDW